MIKKRLMDSDLVSSQGMSRKQANNFAYNTGRAGHIWRCVWSVGEKTKAQHSSSSIRGAGRSDYNWRVAFCLIKRKEKDRGTKRTLGNLRLWYQRTAPKPIAPGIRDWLGTKLPREKSYHMLPTFCLFLLR